MKLNEEMADSEAQEWRSAYTEDTMKAARLARILLNFRRSENVVNEISEASFIATRFIEENG